MKTVWLILFLILAVTGCDEGDFLVPKYPSCLAKLIKHGDPVEIWRYQVEEEDFYLVMPNCCDQLIKLFDTNCKLICSPSGGFSGKGDGTCPDFFQKAIAKELIWRSKTQ